ncbi:aminotransferase class I/II-fold pyridoxal phosphate-dependent enzyme [Streptomyces sp. NPDC048324]|uniref:aminotransferase-like domain-containing protein n=1 Tax=Streptomyces sp. NPDC048324 TaxID=3157205 RepID=UPI00341C523F
MDRVRRTDVPALGPLLGDWRADGDGDGAGSAYRRLAAALRGLVRDGRIPSGTRLPAERRLAAALAVSRTTVTAAYGLLRTTGHAESHHGSGTYAVLPPPARRLPAQRMPGAGEAGQVSLGAKPVKGVGSVAVSGRGLPTSQASLGAGPMEGTGSVAVPGGTGLPVSQAALGAGSAEGASTGAEPGTGRPALPAGVAVGPMDRSDSAAVPGASRPPSPAPASRRTGSHGVGASDMGVIDLVTASLPAPEPWLSGAVDAAGRELARYAHGHGCFPAGLRELRTAVAERYTRRGVPTDPEQILVTSGATGAFALLLRELTEPHDRVAVESPGHPNLVRAVEAAGARPLPVAMRDDAWDVPAWTRALRSAAPRLACLTPDHQQPTGLLMPEDQRRALVDLAASTGVTLLVDETLAELSLTPGAPAPTPPAALDPGGTVVSVGSMAKTLWSGLRVGWIRATPQLVRTLAARRTGVDLAPPVLEQLVVLQLLAHPQAFADVVETQRERARTRRDALVTALRDELPGWSFRVPDGGLALWARTGDRPAGEITVLAERAGVRLAARPASGTDRPHLEHYLRLPFAQPPEVLAEAVRRIARHPKGPAA